MIFNFARALEEKQVLETLLEDFCRTVTRELGGKVETE